jgi:hypothetical protein
MGDSGEWPLFSINFDSSIRTFSAWRTGTPIRR